MNHDLYDISPVALALVPDPGLSVFSGTYRLSTQAAPTAAASTG